MKAKTAEEIVKEFLKQNYWVDGEDGRYRYMSYDGNHTFDAQPVLEDLLEFAAQFREPSIAPLFVVKKADLPVHLDEQPGEQDRIKELEQALSASERIRMSDAQSAIREANSLRGRIQQLEQEIERLNELVTDKTILLDAAKIGCNQRDERIKVLEDALREIERYDGVNSHHASWGDVVSHLQRVARKALTPSQPKDVNTTE